MSPKPIRGKRFKDIKPFGPNSPLTARHLAIPLVGLTMTGLFFVYARSSVFAAKHNAELHRMADGGQISWRNESQRRHGALERPREKMTVRGFVGLDLKGERAPSRPRQNAEGRSSPVSSSSVAEEENALRLVRKKYREGDDG